MSWAQIGSAKTIIRVTQPNQSPVMTSLATIKPMLSPAAGTVASSAEVRVSEAS